MSKLQKNDKQGWSIADEIGIATCLGRYFGIALWRSIWPYLIKCERYMSFDPKFLLLGLTPKKHLYVRRMVHKHTMVYMRTMVYIYTIVLSFVIVTDLKCLVRYQYKRN